MEHRRTMARNLGLVLALSTPVTSFVTFALFAVIFGEEHFDAAQGITALGYAVMSIPLVLGLAFALTAHLGGPLPTRKHLVPALALLGAAFLAVGLWSMVAGANDSDASIGGAFLVFGGLALFGVGYALHRSADPPPPPSPTPNN